MPRILRILPYAGVASPEHEVGLPPGKPYAALCVVALEPQGVTRDDLAALIWPGADARRARHSVRQALTTIRGVIGPAALAEDGGRLELAGSEVTTDLAELEALIRSGDLGAAFTRWHGGPFAGFSLADAPGFNEWADRIRSRYETLLGSCLVAAANAHAEAGEDAEAAALFSKALAVRAYDEPTHVGLVRLLIRLERFDEADAALDRARIALDEPTPGALEALHGEVVAARRSALAREEEPALLTLDFVGRTNETATLRRLWKSALTGRPRAAAILGPAGIGKTRLAESVIRSMRMGGATLVHVKAPDADRSIDLAFLADLVRELTALPGAAGISNASHSVLRRLLPSLGGAAREDTNGEVLDTALADAVFDLVEAVADESPLILFLDDLQWVDRRSRHLVLRVLRALRDVPVFSVMTCRSSDSDQSTTRWLRSEADLGRLEILELGPLSREQVEETLHASIHIVPAEAFDRVASSLFSTSQGNPLFLVELLRLLIDQEVVTEQRGEWRLDGDRLAGDWPLPTSVRQTLTERLVALSDDARLLAAFLARQGSGTGASRLGPGSGLDHDRVPGALSELLGAGVVAWTDEEHVDFVHDSLRSVARRLLATPRTRRSRWLMPTMAAGAAAIASVAMYAGLDGRIQEPAASPFLGGGTIYAVDEPGELRSFEPPVRPDGPWREQPPIPIPVAASLVPAPGPDGRVRFFASLIREDDRVPYPAELFTADEGQPLSRHPGDTNLTSLHPGQRFALLSVADESGGHYRQDVVLLDLLTGTERLVHPAPSFGVGYWAPDGRTLMVTTRTLDADTVHVLRADGSVRASQVVQGPNRDFTASPCGLDGMRALVARSSSSVVEVALVDMRTGAVTPLPTIGPASTAASCSPDGSAFVSAQLIEGSLRLVATEIGSGRAHIGPRVSSGSLAGWIGSNPHPFPAGVRVEPDTLTMAWGDSESLEARFVGPTSGLALDEIEWVSEDPRVAYVAADGRVAAQGEGTTRVVASAFGLLADTVVVRVRTGTPSDALLVDRFEAFDERRWSTIGSLRATPVGIQGRLALDASGGGVGVNGLLSREGFDLSRGGTLELSYRLPLTRTDRQSVRLCLLARSGEGPPVRGDGGASDEGRICFFHPIGQLNLFDPSAYALDGQVQLGSYRDSALFPSDDWRHVTLILAPDGAARLLVEHEEVASIRNATANDPHLRWYVALYSRAVDTQLLIRDLVLWEGMRY